MTSSQHPLERVNLRNPIHFLALGFGSGLLHPAPGTWGSLVGVVLGALLLPWLGAKTFFYFDHTLFLPWYLVMRTHQPRHGRTRPRQHCVG